MRDEVIRKFRSANEEIVIRVRTECVGSELGHVSEVSVEWWSRETLRPVAEVT